MAWKGEMTLLPVILSRLFTCFMVISGLAQFGLAELSYFQSIRYSLSLDLLLTGVVIEVLALVLVWAENRIDNYLI